MKFCLAQCLSVFLVFLLISYPYQIVFASYGGNALFYCEPLNGKTGENEVKLMVDTDAAEINHLIFDLVDDTTYDITGSNDPIDFPLHNNNVLGTETPFTSVSGDYAYDLASANPVNLSDGVNDIHFATVIADQNLPTGPGGSLEYDVDTAIYVNAAREGTATCAYTVLPNEAPVISLPAVNGVDLSISTVAPSELNPLPTTLVQEVSVNPTLTYSVTDSTDASVRRRMYVYKRLDDGSWNYSSSVSASANYARSGTVMTFSKSVSLDFSSYYKVVFKAIDDQGAEDEEAFYFSTQPDNIAPNQVPRAFTTFISDSDDRSNVIAQISFVRTTDNDAVSDYYIWSHDYLVAKGIIDMNGVYLGADLNVDLRSLISAGNYVAIISEGDALSSPYISITGNEVDKVDTGEYLVQESMMEDIFYIVAADVSTTIAGEYVPNFSGFSVVNKFGDVFGAEVSVGGYDYMTGDGSLDVWDSVYLYRNIIGRNGEYPVMVPDMIYSNAYVYPSNLSTSSSTLN